MDAQQQTGHGVMDDPNSTALPQAFHGTGKIPFRMYEDSKQVSQAVAAEIASLILSLIHISSPRDKRQSRMPSSA